VIDPAQAELHDALYSAAIELFEPYFEEGGGRPPRTENEVQQVRRACELLERVLAIYPENWNAAWTLGMARRSVGDYEHSYRALRQAYALEPANETVAREHTGACMMTHRDEEAIAVARDAVARAPDNAALISNLALAYLLAGRFDEATAPIAAARRIDQDDAITARLAMVIDNLALGRFDEAEKLLALFVERSPTDLLTARLLEVVQKASRARHGPDTRQ
jgi:tetratricopeptide (TPR) repeat protein